MRRLPDRPTREEAEAYLARNWGPPWFRRLGWFRRGSFVPANNPPLIDVDGPNREESERVRQKPLVLKGDEPA